MSIDKIVIMNEHYPLLKEGEFKFYVIKLNQDNRVIGDDFLESVSDYKATDELFGGCYTIYEKEAGR